MEMFLFCIIVLGFNFMGYDEEVICFGFWCNLFLVYDWEWVNNNLCYDMMNMFVVFWVLKVLGIIWFEREDGRGVLLKFEYFVVSNGIM